VIADNELLKYLQGKQKSGFKAYLLLGIKHHGIPVVEVG